MPAFEQGILFIKKIGEEECIMHYRVQMLLIKP
jgi:hypothetical protein